MNILVVDDEEGLRMTMAANLELEGFVVTEAENGFQALELAKQQPFDLVLSDMRMPQMDGLELMRQLKNVQPNTPVVLMTGFEREESIKNALSEGVFTVLTKPCDVTRVVQTLMRAQKRQNVLVIDDSPADAQSTVDALLATGVRARAAFDGDSAIEAIASGDIDVLVTDLVMPGMSGTELVERVRAIAPNVSVIAVSGYAVPEMLQKVATDGAYACMRKPFHARELIQVIAMARGEARVA
jgi:DNA-binding NtrC family response regulator